MTIQNLNADVIQFQEVIITLFLSAIEKSLKNLVTSRTNTLLITFIFKRKSPLIFKGYQDNLF